MRYTSSSRPLRPNNPLRHGRAPFVRGQRRASASLSQPPCTGGIISLPAGPTMVRLEKTASRLSAPSILRRGRRLPALVPLVGSAYGLSGGAHLSSGPSEWPWRPLVHLSSTSRPPSVGGDLSSPRPLVGVSPPRYASDAARHSPVEPVGTAGYTLVSVPFPAVATACSGWLHSAHMRAGQQHTKSKRQHSRRRHRDGPSRRRLISFNQDHEKKLTREVPRGDAGPAWRRRGHQPAPRRQRFECSTGAPI